jgi:L-alanine-DL-glutamate epimerase-like enolase superfamily enzyme
MKIKRVEIIPITIPYKMTFLHSWGGRKVGNYIVLRLTTDEGICGVGSGAVLDPMHSGESLDTASSHIARIATSILIGQDPFNIEKIMDRINMALHGNWLTKAHIDFALFDIKGKALGVPVYQLLGGLCREKVPLDFIISLDEPDAMAVMAKKYKDAGFSGLKVKSGGNPDLDIERVKKVREAVGAGYRIGVDMNGAYKPKTALRVIEEMMSFAITFVEEPIGRTDKAGLKFVRDRAPVPIAVDESGWSLEEAQGIIEANAADIFVIVPSRIGGLMRSLKYKSLVEAHGLETCISCYTGTGIEHAATAHLIAASSKEEAFPDEAVPVLYLFGGVSSDQMSGDIIKKASGIIKDGYLSKPEGPGLGVELDDDVVMRYVSPGGKPLILE